MKKGDIIGRINRVEAGMPLLANIETRDRAATLLQEVRVLHGLSPDFPLVIGPDRDNLGKYAVSSTQELVQTEKAKVNWVVGDEAGVVHLSRGGGCSVVSTGEWTVLEESAPEYQTSVEHMTDEQLRESIEALRARRGMVAEPRPRSKARASAKLPPMDAQDKKIAALLSNLTGDKKEALMRKLGMA